MLLAANFSFAQTFAPPTKQEKLLNGLKVLIWNEPKAEKVSLRLRVHSGSAFDPKDKMGTMALLADILFPDEQTRRFFEEDLEGSLEITGNYDYIQINATAKTDDFLTILETIATAVANPPITQENFVKVRDARLKSVEEMQKNPAYLADMAVARRLLGDFPYGRPQAGTPESLKLIDRADLLTARDRFFTADNATLAVTGNVKPDFAYMAARRLFGAWKKADKLVPATFRQPDAPQAGLPVLDSPVQKTSEFRFAMRGIARNDKDFYASRVLRKILQNRLQRREGKNAFVRQDAHLLPGLFIFGVPEWNLGLIKKDGNAIALPIMDGYQNYFLKDAIKPEEFEKAKSEFLTEFSRTSQTDFWLDADTFKLSAPKTELQNAQNITLADAQKVLERLQKEPVALVLLFADDAPNVKPAPTGDH
jgi:predicted Zn-dependent peptidase